MTTYYVRSDGGTQSQSTGLVDAAYPGSGSGTASAWNDPQIALTACTYGDTIIIRAGDTFSPDDTFHQPYYLQGKGTPPTNTDADFITVQSSAVASLPAERVSPGDAVNMPKLTSLGYGGVFISGDANGSAVQKAGKYWKLVGLEITNSAVSSETPGNLVTIGAWSGAEHFWIDRCYIHPKEDGTEELYRTMATAIAFTTVPGLGIEITNDIRITNNHISGFGGLQPSTTEVGNYLALLSGVVDNVLVHNNFVSSTLQPWFPAGADPTNYTVGIVQASPSPTLSVFTLDTVTGLSVGDYVTVEQPDYPQACGRVASISGFQITLEADLYRLEGCPTCAGTPGQIPVAGYEVWWNGAIATNLTVTRNTFDIEESLADHVRAVTGPQYSVDAVAATNVLSGATMTDGV